MDEPGFDRWTRRRVGLAGSGLAASLLSLATASNGEARRKGKKKLRCRKQLQSCAPQGKHERCCSGLNCDPVDGQIGLRCCFGRQHRCQSVGQCCGDTLCEEVAGLEGDRCCSSGGFCTSNEDCCFGAPCTGGQCEVPSDRAIKTNFGSIDGQDMLERVRDLPISTWNYTSDDAAVRHIGPMVQDVAAIFGVGADDRHIHPVDGQGVALAAIQGLAELATGLRQEQAWLTARVSALEQSDARRATL
ncbi:MAG: tail fiber domain-containing protein [Thermomicrobiales bacterium]